MSKPTMFSSGVELGNLLLSSDLLLHSWDAIVQLYRETPPNHDPTSPLSIKCRVHPQSPIGTIISFVSSPPCTPQYLQAQGRDLLASSDALAKNFPLFQFVGTKVNPTFSLHRAAVSLFYSLQDQLSLLKTQYEKTRPLIVTGHSIGGSIATLFTLWLLEAVPPTDKERPLCITFGCPLIGDTGLQQAISERPTWNSCFLHVASNKDPIPRLFTSPQNERSTESGYKPFGTFLLCAESGFACFEEPESALDLMVATNSDGVGNGGPHEGAQMFCYGEILEKYKHGVICRGVSQLEENDFTPLQMGIFIQIAPINVETTQRRLENVDINSLITKIERTKDLAARKRKVFNPEKKLNEMKINMTYVEWFKKVSVPLGGYYDIFRNERSTRREEIVKRKTILTHYWVKMVNEAEKRPQKEGKFFLIRCLYGGNNYRRIVEPLDIAEFYKKGKKDYLTQRSDHYKLLEKWMEDEKSKGNQGNAEKRNRACSLTEDSCFWAYVEEAMISCELLKNGETNLETKESLRAGLVKFEDYVMDLVRKYAVSTEIFLEQSSFMQWWKDYKKIKGASYRSSLADFMNNCKYKQYA
ncbi:hypothetical protein RHSIM_Rhsim10G0027700 [Rhododendron simsii]|uniref:Senescence-associated carboxylesterase 101 n=1 Tax=Rhododendron simsii TaxID=118357 RepID=A0A834LD07_RHOSS|nr:hypothetical protein RHSIM_Rhsim10G0027700 [Rhododendron simsii]